MKIILKKPLWFTVVMTLCLVAGTLFAVSGCDKHEKFEIEHVKTKLGDCNIQLPKKINQEYKILLYKGLEKDAPNLFFLTSTFIILYNGGSELNISYGKYVDFENIEIAPSNNQINK